MKKKKYIRTSRIGITDVKLFKISGLNLYVKGLDAFQGSPVLDIKATIKNKNMFDNQEVIK
jgi:tRNA (Thr-GGU) A37 N-methylase